MTHSKVPQFPDFTDKRVIDRHMDQHNLSGLSRREFLAFSTASAIAATAASALGIPGVAVAAANGKMAHLMMTLRLEYVVNADAGAKAAAEALGLEHTSVDGQLDSERQLNQFSTAAAEELQEVELCCDRDVDRFAGREQM